MVTISKRCILKYDTHKLVKSEENKEEVKPKKLFKAPGGGNSAFSQIMRMEMSKTNETGPRKLD